ncbi:MAG: hypothetical protein LC105_10335 [Chitinophagales bacterium]|nr:hypothetical protein [Chitinophagales bacterium]MCZ2394245.1 hypothetical protein [Chitinophagales bacterium]
MKWSQYILFVALLTMGLSCNKKVGCPATDAVNRQVNVNDNKQGITSKKQAEKQAHSSVLPQEVRIGKKKKR